MSSQPDINSITDPHIVGSFSFKSKTLNGKASRIETYIYSNEVVVINKVVVSTEDLTNAGFTLIRQYKWFGLYSERIILLKKSLMTVFSGFNLLEKQNFISS